MRISGEHSLPLIIFPDGTIHLGSGCARLTLAEDAQICISAGKAPPSSAVQNQGGGGNGTVGRAEMAHTALVLEPAETAVRTALENSTE